MKIKLDSAWTKMGLHSSCACSDFVLEAKQAWPQNLEINSASSHYYTVYTGRTEGGGKWITHT